MGMIHDISETVSLETRRGSFVLIVTGAIVDQNGNTGLIEMAYADLPDLRKALETAEQERRS